MLRVTCDVLCVACVRVACGVCSGWRQSQALTHTRRSPMSKTRRSRASGNEIIDEAEPIELA